MCSEASLDSDAGESAAIGHRPRIKGGRLAYQPLEDHEKGEKSQQAQPPTGATFALVEETNRAPQSGRAGSRTAGAVELVSFNRRGNKAKSRYELLEDDDNDDSDTDERGTDTGTVRGGDSATPRSIAPRDHGGGDDADGVMSSEEMPLPAEIGEKDPGIFGAGGLLSTPNVKLVIFIATIVQASSNTTSEGRGWHPNSCRLLSSELVWHVLGQTRYALPEQRRPVTKGGNKTFGHPTSL